MLNRFAIRISDDETIEIEQYAFGHHAAEGPPHGAALALGVNSEDGVPDYEYVIRVLSPIPLSRIVPGPVSVYTDTRTATRRGEVR